MWRGNDQIFREQKRLRAALNDAVRSNSIPDRYSLDRSTRLGALRCLEDHLREKNAYRKAVGGAVGRTRLRAALDDAFRSDSIQDTLQDTLLPNDIADRYQLERGTSLGALARRIDRLEIQARENLERAAAKAPPVRKSWGPMQGGNAQIFREQTRLRAALDDAVRSNSIQDTPLLPNDIADRYQLDRGTRLGALARRIDRLEIQAGKNFQRAAAKVPLYSLWL